ncbi:MAG TPA: hypothetical protein VGP72_12185 [Planctomycetota bacterium]|jgi:hypothetical protein
MKFTMFYSWQSDLPNNCNRSFILKALEDAAESLRADASIMVEPAVDRDTAGVAGSPDIGRTILQKIDNAHAFVADLSIINSGYGRPSPNPNVLFELGYAWKHLTESRIILVVNTVFGEPEQLPFDLRTKRVMAYRIAEDATEKGQERRKLQAKMEHAIRDIIGIEPKAMPPSPETIVRLFLIEKVTTGSQTVNAKLHNIGKNAALNLVGGCSHTDGSTGKVVVPPYIEAGAKKEAMWKLQEPQLETARTVCWCEYSNEHGDRFKMQFIIDWQGRNPHFSREQFAYLQKTPKGDRWVDLS